MDQLAEKFEDVLLKALIYNGQFFGKVMPILKEKYFSQEYSELFGLVKKHYSLYKQIPTLNELVASVKDVPNAEIRSTIISSLKHVNSIPLQTNVEFLCNQTVSWVKDALYFEALQLGSDGLMRKDDNLKLKAQAVMEERAKVSIDSDLGLDLDDIDTMIEYYSSKLVGIRTQHKQLNERLGPGFLPGTLSVVLAAQGVGKSLLMTDLISGMVKDNKNVLLVSLEMADKEIMKRVHANAMDLPINSLIDLSKSDGELREISKKRSIINKEDVINAYNKFKLSGKCGKLFVKDYPAGAFSPLMLEQLVESYEVERNVKFDIVFVDYLGIMKSDLISPTAGLYSYIKSIGEEVRAVAKKLNLPIVSASQLNRSSVNQTDADNSAISDSLGTAMTADFMLFLLQNEELKATKSIVAKVTKNRFTGKTDTWLMDIDYEHMRFSDAVIQPNNDVADIGGTQIINKPADHFGDFSTIPTKQQLDAEVKKLDSATQFAKQEINAVYAQDIKNVVAVDKKINQSEIDIFRELGLDI